MSLIVQQYMVPTIANSMKPLKQASRGPPRVQRWGVSHSQHVSATGAAA